MLNNFWRGNHSSCRLLSLPCNVAKQLALYIVYGEQWDMGYFIKLYTSFCSVYVYQLVGMYNYSTLTNWYFCVR